MLAGALARAAPASAAPSIRVDAQACAGVAPREVERLLAIDLEALGPTGAIEVGLTCTGARLRMTARDPVLGRALVREVEIGPPDPGRDRTIALLVSQLFLTSWAEEFLEHPVPRPAPAVSRPVAATAGPPPPAPASWDVQLAAGARLRDWVAPALAEHVSVAGGRRAGRLRLLVLAGFEHGAADRAAGSVVWNLGELGAGVGWSSGRRHRVAFSAALTSSAALVHVQGEAASPASAGSSVAGVVGQAALAAGPCLAGDRWQAGLQLEVGATWPGATARVSGDRDLSLGGPWAGAGLWIGWGRP